MLFVRMEASVAFVATPFIGAAHRPHLHTRQLASQQPHMKAEQWQPGCRHAVADVVAMVRDQAPAATKSAIGDPLARKFGEPGGMVWLAPRQMGRACKDVHSLGGSGWPAST